MAENLPTRDREFRVQMVPEPTSNSFGEFVVTDEGLFEGDNLTGGKETWHDATKSEISACTAWELPYRQHTSCGQKHASRFSGFRWPLQEEATEASTTDVLPREFAEAIFSRLVRASDSTMNLLFDLLRTHSDPNSILDATLKEARNHGGERPWSMALSLFVDMGEAAWPALCRIAKMPGDDCILFISAIAQCPGISESERLAALKELAKNLDESVRWEVLSEADLLPSSIRRELLQVMAEDPSPAIRDTVRSELEID